MELLEEIRLSWTPMDEQPELLWAPMEQFELWAPKQKDQGMHGLLADQRLRLASAATIGLEVKDNPAHDDGDPMILQLLEDPRDEGDLHEWLSGTKQANSNNEIKSCTKRSNVEAFVWGGRRQRKCRIRRTSWRSYMLGFRKPSTCRSWNNTRKNNPHWKEQEASMLLDGLSKYGVGRWTKIKAAYFGTSIRTAAHLKDKWKNLREASGTKVKAQKSTQEILGRLEDQIISIDKKHAAKQRRRASRQKQRSLCY
ncbi:hypothetical protein QOZ80_2BG0181790 [Eleusine coracana subsp. coracana]|nr:hypothetical protein QOZ80_2BG0181790 [Eleusine coracana subsp. coracana]